jgi:hypothetical protein
MFFVMTEDALVRKGTVVLQSCAVSPGVLWGLCSDTSVTSPNDAPEVISVKVEGGTGIDIKEEQFPDPIPSPAIKTEPDEVSHRSVCPLLNTFWHYSEMCPLLLCYCHLHFSVCPHEQWQMWICLHIYTWFFFVKCVRSARQDLVKQIYLDVSVRI